MFPGSFITAKLVDVTRTLPHPSLHIFICDCLIIDAKLMNHPTFQFQDTETSDTNTLMFASCSLVEQFKLENL